MGVPAKLRKNIFHFAYHKLEGRPFVDKNGEKNALIPAFFFPLRTFLSARDLSSDIFHQLFPPQRLLSVNRNCYLLTAAAEGPEISPESRERT